MITMGWEFGFYIIWFWQSAAFFVQHKLSSQKGRRHLERFSRKYIELCPIIVTEQRCRTPDLVSEKVLLCFWQDCRNKHIFRKVLDNQCQIHDQGIIEGEMFQNWYIMMIAIVYHHIWNEYLQVCNLLVCIQTLLIACVEFEQCNHTFF